MKLKLFFLSVLLFAQSALAARSGQIIVDEANVYEYPQYSSKTISKLKKGEGLTVSNLPTEGFYKVRLRNGDLGWVSGNDLLVANNAPSGSSAPAPSRSSLPRNDYPSDAVADSNPYRSNNDYDSKDRDWRLNFGGGLQNLSYNGFGNTFENAASLNYGTNLGVELQWRAVGNLFWAFRTDILLTSGAAATLTNTDTQSLKETNVPIQFGLNFSFIDTGQSRLSFGLYGGISISKMSVTQSKANGASVTEDYSTVSPVVLGSIQGVYGLGKVFGLFGEIGYRYEKTGTFGQTTIVETAAIPAFSIDYSGVIGRIGLEMRF